MKRFRDLSLTAQLVLIVAAALFAAQAVNFALLLRETRALAESRSVEPAAVRLLMESGRAEFSRARPRGGDWRERLRPPRPEPPRLRPGERRLPRIEASIAERLAAAGAPARDVRAFVRRWERHGREEHVLLAAASFDPEEWVVTRARAPLPAAPLAARLVLQTLVIFAVTLLPLMLFARRSGRTLKRLSSAARTFRGHSDSTPLTPQGAADIRALTEEFNAMRARIAAMMAEKDQMLGAIGHDLRTPLASLRIRAEAVEDDDERQAMIASIEDMHGDLEDILLLARAGRAEPDISPLALRPLVDDLAADQRRTGRDVRVEGSMVDDVFVRANAASLRRALRNLIDNAVLYGGDARILVTRGKDGIHIAVHDDGPGIAEADLERAAHPFVRLEGSRNRQTGGSGLGLAIARQVASAHGGRLHLSNRSEGGLSAAIILPEA